MNCLVCKTPFTPRRDNVKSGGGKYCSRKCSAIDRSAKQKHFKKCLCCGVVFHAYKKKMRFCSRKCAHIISPPRFNPNRSAVIGNRKMAAFCCRVIARCLTSKTTKFSILLGYTPKELRHHIESRFSDGMTWDNYGHTGKKWHIDHIKPISRFSVNTPINEINALSNLQPMWASENFRKGNRV